MSVMLRSTNPDAIGEIDPDRDRRRPHIGQIVIFHSRPGEGRMGKMAAPALVTAVEDDDHVELLIHYAADDAITRWKIPRRTDQNPFNSWSFNEDDEAHYQRVPTPSTGEPAKVDGRLTWDDVKAMHAEIGHLRNRLAALEVKPRRGRPPKPHESGEADTGEIEGAELASELGYEREPPAA